MSANPHANGGGLLRDLVLPDFRDYAVDVLEPGMTSSEAMRVLGGFLRDIVSRNPDNFRVFGPDETASNRLGALFEVTSRAWSAETLPTDEGLAPDGRVMEILSEHLCQGWLEGYLLTGRHGVFNCYEAFIHIVDSMFNQHAKWLKVTRDIPWRRPIASLNYLLSSHVWRQDHNGLSHQDPGFIDHVVNKKAEVIRVYLPPDANTLLSVADHCLRSRHYVNVIVAGKQPALNYLSMDDAIVHCTRGLGIWEWASNDDDGEPDVVLACCGDIPTLETLAASAILRERLPGLKVRVVNVVDLMRLQPESEHPHGLPDTEFDSLFTQTDQSCSRITATPGLSTASRTGAPTTGTCMSAATRRKARQRRLSTWSCSTTSTGSIWSWTSSTAFPVLPSARRTFGRRCPTGAFRHGRIRASTETTIPRFATGPGRSDFVGAVLVVNAGSTSLKLRLVSENEQVEEVESFEAVRSAEVEAVGHRVVHGGPHLVEPTLIDDAVRVSIGELESIAPLHNAPSLAGIDVRRSPFPGVPQVAVFDTAFHTTIPAEASTYALPRIWREEWGIRRYGFHGLSVQWCAERAPELLGRSQVQRRLVVCHLGGGCSITAVRDGRSSTRRWLLTARGRADDHPLGLDRSRRAALRTAAARCVARGARPCAERGIGPERPVRAERRHSRAGSGCTGGRTCAACARRLRHRIAGAVGAMAASSGGLDALVFTAGVGEHSPGVRAAVCTRLAFLSVELERDLNEQSAPDGDVASSESAVRVLVIAAREELVVARAVRTLLQRT